MFMCRSRIIRFGSVRIRWRLSCICSFIILRHVDWGINGYKLSTSMATKTAESRMCRVCSRIIKEVELLR